MYIPPSCLLFVSLFFIATLLVGLETIIDVSVPVWHIEKRFQRHGGILIREKTEHARTVSTSASAAKREGDV